MVNRLATWRQTHDLAAALGVDVAHIPVQYRDQIARLLGTLPPDQAERMLNNLHDSLGQAKTAAEVGAIIQGLPQPPPTTSRGPSETQVLQRLGIPPSPSAYTASQQQASGAVTQDPSVSAPQLSQQDAAAQAFLEQRMHPESGQQDVTILASYLGTTPDQVRQQYQSYLAGFQASIRPPTGATAAQRRLANQNADQAPLGMGDWVASQTYALEGQNAVILNAYVTQYEAQTGTPMPGDLRQQLRQALLNLPPGAQAEVTAAIASMTAGFEPAGGTVTAPSAAAPAGAGAATTTTTAGGISLPFLDDVITNYENAHPPAQQLQQKVLQQRISQYYAAFGRMPDQATQQQLGSMTDPQWQQQLNNTYQYFNVLGQMPSASMQQHLNGMSATEMNLWQKNITTLAQAWYDNFGSMPSEQQMLNASTMNSDELNDYINNSQSRIHGMTIGQFDGAKTALDPVYKKEFGHEAPDEIVQYFHQAHLAEAS